MRDATLTFFTTSGVREAVPRWLEPVLSAWPDPALPRVVVAAGPGEAAGVVLGILGRPESSGASVRGLVDDLIDRGGAGVLLCDPAEGAEALRSRAQRDGVILEDQSADAARIAAMLYALLERQPAVADLSRDLRIAHAAQGGLCGEMDRLHEELNLASRVQRQFIPRVMPRVDGLEFAALFRPAGYVSGDIFDIRQVDEEKWAFFLADVVGHGVPAALLTMVVSRALVTRERVGKEWRPVSPSDALARINDELCTQPEGPQRFATAVYGTVDAATREVVMAGAGHPPPLLVDPRGQVVRLEMEGPLLGVFDGAEFPQIAFTMPADRTLLLYTDGFELAFPEEGGGRGGLKRPTTTYLSHLGQLAAEDAEGRADLGAALRRLEELLDAQLGSLNRNDDVTALAVAARPRTLAPAAPLAAA
jgi:sigma-B regulation protein RsbU (phosphoserine phosphatase)